MKKYNVWNEGYSVTGNDAKAAYLGEHEASSFKEACKIALKVKKWDMKFYREDENVFWDCKFFDNEKDARKEYG